MDAHSIRVLEFEAIKDWLASRTSTLLGEEKARALYPALDKGEAEKRLDETREFREILAKGGLPSFHGILDVRSSITHARIEGTVLLPQELLRIASTLEGSERLRSFFRQQKSSYPCLAPFFARLRPMEDLIERVRRVVLEDGNISDDASGRLRSLRLEIRRLREGIYSALQSILHDPACQRVVAEPLVTIRNERYVIPVRPNFRVCLRGIVQDQSGSGQTVFLEPAEVVELNNRLRQAHLLEEKEVRRILARLTRDIGMRSGEIGDTLEALGDIDFIHAKALLAEELNCHQPKLNEGCRLFLWQARHPLLIKQSAVSTQRSASIKGIEDGRLKTEDKAVVPIDVRLGETFQALVITGPNTGGKTVALKTIGLLTLMALSGLHIPASPDSEVPFYEKIYADIGDEQSIEQSLSTFSSHLNQIVRILSQANNRSLVLLDELGAGTDPAEGAALGIAILEELIQLGAFIVATTHLEAIKAFAYTEPRMENAFVEFDLDSLRPMYRLSIGLPGKSYALEVASQLGISKEVINRARRRLGERGLHLRSLIERLEKDHREAELKRAFWEKEAREAEVLKARQEEILRALEGEAREKKRQALQEASRVITEARKEAQRVLGEIRSLTSQKERQRKLSELDLFQKALVEDIARLRVEDVVPLEPLKLDEARIGQEVWVGNLGQKGFLLSLPSHDGLVEVQLPMGRARVPCESLHPSKGETRRVIPVLPLFLREEKGVGTEICLLGCTPEEALAKVVKYLDDAFITGLGRVRIIHGKGKGVLRKVVKKVLENHPLVEDFGLAPFDEGGSGATVVKLQSKSPGS